MTGPFKKLLKKTPLYPLWLERQREQREQQALRDWEKAGRPLPPPQRYKRTLILDLAKKYQTGTFIETGTYYGDTLEACRRSFKRSFSIELSQELFQLARQRFAGATDVTLLQGDSGQVIAEILPTISAPCLFWLDGHYSEGVTAKGNLNTPVLAELSHILAHPVKNHVILIDDARCFTGEDDYPTLDELRAYVAARNPALEFSVDNDIICLC